MRRLKECPFCGETETFSEYTVLECGWMEDKQVRCDNCGALGPPCSSLEQAKTAWDDRHPINKKILENSS